jgi:purine-binding chemotaxis protein CheW
VSTALHVVFKVGGTEYLIPAMDVVQMEAYTGATAVPGAPPYVAGIVQVRGRVVPVVDLRARFGLPAAVPGLESRLVLGRAGERTVALLVDSAREVLKVADEQIRPPPKLVADQARGFVKAVAQIGDRLMMLVDFNKIIGEEGLDRDGQQVARG